MNYEIRYYTAPFLVTRGKDRFTPDVTTWCLSSGNRKPHTCVICKKQVERGIPMWRPAGAFANAQNRSHRICVECVERRFRQEEVRCTL